MSRIILEGVTKRFGKIVALDNLSLEIDAGEFFCLLGPSGCGKTTAMRCIAGLEIPEEGKIWIDDRLVFDRKDYIFVPAKNRKIGMVFQSYALWPHLTVRDNVLFGLQIRKVDKKEQTRKLNETLELLQISAMEERYPNELSGGQQQRVALARELITGAGILLLDEPLSNLDARLRIDMRYELKRLHEETKRTFVYVTHDQIEALTLSSRLCIMRNGLIQQEGKPDDVYEAPGNLFVATFMGSGTVGVNMIHARIENGQLISGRFRIPVPALSFKGLPEDSSRVIIVVRPEEIKVLEKSEDESCVPCTIINEMLMGPESLLTLRFEEDDEQIIRALHDRRFPVSDGMKVWVRFSESNVHVFNPETETSIIERIRKDV